MRYITFEEKRFNSKSEETIEKADSIIQEYIRDGYTLTLRQLYYQFVARGLIENSERSYKNLGNLVNDARIAGRLPWDGIEDRGREHTMPYVQDDIPSIFEGIEHHYAPNLWENQENYVEAWIEKEALGNVLERPCRRWDVPYMSCKGYLSASAAWRAGERFEEAKDAGKTCYLLHLGDHDPSGIDMTRDNDSRLELFSNQSGVIVKRLALNMDQVRQYRPPPNPAKITDSRAEDYIRKFGNESWELDALEPSVIDNLVERAIRDLIDMDQWRDDEARRDEAREHLAKFSQHYDAIEAFVRSL